LENDKLALFQTRLTTLAQEQLAHKVLQKTMSIDAEINLRGVTYDLVHDIQNLQPFGYHNPTPKFVSRNLKVQQQRAVGRDGAHLKLKLSDGRKTWDAIGFQMGRYGSAENRLDKLDAVYTLEFNHWNGATNLQLNLKDIRRVNGS
jgi:single-stranded-DNA-specific exonuclease